MRHPIPRCLGMMLLGIVFLKMTFLANEVTAQSAATYRTLAVDAQRRLPRLRSEPVQLRERAVPITSAVFSRDGTSVTTVDGKGRVVRWDLVTPGNREQLANLDIELACAVLSDDAKLLAFAAQDGTVAMIELAAKTQRLHAEAPTARTVALAFSKDGGLLAGVTDAGNVHVWDAVRGKLIRRLSVEPNPVQSIAFSTDGKELAVASFSNEVRLFDLGSENHPKVLDVGKSRVTALAYSQDDSRLVIACADGSTRVYDLSGESQPVILGMHVFAVWRLAFDATGERLATASWDGTIRVWDTTNWKLLETHKSHEESISAMVFGPQGDLVSTSVNGPLKHWLLDIPRRQATAMIAGRADSVWVAVYSPDGKTLFVGGREKRFELWDLTTNQILISREGHATTRCAAFSPDGETLATGGDDGKVSLWNPRTGERKAELLRHPGAVSAVVYTPHGETLVSACDGGVVKLWDSQTGNEKASWREHKKQIYCANISLDGKWLLTGGGEWTSDARGELIVWELATGRVRSKLDGHRLAVWTIAFTPDGRRFATSCSSGEVKVWDLETLGELTTLPHETWIRALAFSPDGKTLAVGVGDGSVRLWDTADWKQKAWLEGHESFTFFVQFAPDGKTLATSGNDGTVRFWPARL